MAFFEQTKITDQNGNVINPAEQQTLYSSDPPDAALGPAVRTAWGSVDDQITLLRRIVKLMESQAATDPQQRQRVVIDTTSTVTIAAGTAAIGNVTLGAGSASIGNANVISTVTSITNLAGQFGWNQQILSDPARVSYNTGIRQQITFSNT
jgi:hypothetical protein